MTNKNRASVTLSTAFIRLFLGFGSGVLGTIILGVIIFLSWNVVGEFITQSPSVPNEVGIIKEAPKVHPLFLNFITIAIFLAGLGATMTFGVLLSVVEDRFRRKATMLTQIFVGNLVILILMIPIYFFSDHLGSQGLLMSLIVHAVLITLFSYLSMVATNRDERFLVHLYGIIVSIILFYLLFSFIFQTRVALLVFILFPSILAFTGFGTALTEMFYQWVHKIYGEDFLSDERNYGKDYELE